MSKYQISITRVINYKKNAPDVWMHESRIHPMIEKIEGESKRGTLTKMLKCLKKGYMGERNKNSFQKIDEGITDFYNESNEDNPQ